VGVRLAANFSFHPWPGELEFQSPSLPAAATPFDTMSAAGAASQIVDDLSDSRILPGPQFEELIRDILPRCADWRIVAPELVYRGWLTPFQAQRLVQGRGRELVLGSYVLLEPIGEGGMGFIFRARNWKLDTPVAVKLIRPDRADDPTAVGRFVREVRALGAIRHPHVVHALDADVEGDRLYCAMEYVAGTDLGRLLADRGALPIETACRFAAQLAEALRHISSLGLVHRDLKPANVLVTEDGTTAKLSDLGLARFDHPDWGHARADLTRLGMMIGTPDYVAPEQIRDSRAADIRSDLYSLGCTLYHMLAGRPPFAGLDLMDKLHHQQTVDPVPVELLRPDVPASVAVVVRTLLAKRPRDRYQDPAEVATALRPYLQPTGDTVADASAPTAPGLPVPAPQVALPRTEEISVGHLILVTDETAHVELGMSSAREWAVRWLNRLHWLIAALIAGVAMGIVIGRR
jgi:serine/threonine protein kinase